MRNEIDEKFISRFDIIFNIGRDKVLEYQLLPCETGKYVT